MFTVRLPCPGFEYYDQQRRVQAHCHESLYGNFIEIAFSGSPIMEVEICSHVRDGTHHIPYGRFIEDFLEANYAPIRMDDGLKGNVAFKTGLNHYYNWSLCLQCGNGDSRRGGDYCSEECHQAATGLLCKCGKASKTRMSNDGGERCVFEPFMHCLVRVHGLNELRDKLRRCRKWQPDYAEYGNYCSLQCATLASHSEILRTKREVKRLAECQKVKRMKSLLVTAKKSLRQGSQEALHTLKEEFEREATLQE